MTDIRDLTDEDDVAFAHAADRATRASPPCPGSSFFSRPELGRTKLRFAFPKRLETLDGGGGAPGEDPAAGRAPERARSAGTSGRPGPDGIGDGRAARRACRSAAAGPGRSSARSTSRRCRV